MGFQNGNDNGQTALNQRSNQSSVGRTSTTSKLAQNTSKSQYQRLGNSNAVDSRGVTAKYFETSNPVVDNARENQSSVGRTSGVSKVQKYQNYNNNEQFTKTSPLSSNPD